MTIIGMVVASLAGLVVAFMGLQIFMVRQMKRRVGTPAPDLEGPAGRLVRTGQRAMFYFYSPQCGACRAMTPVVQGMARNNRAVVPVDVSRDFDMARSFGVMATPTTILVEAGKVVRVLVGPQGEATLQALWGTA